MTYYEEEDQRIKEMVITIFFKYHLQQLLNLICRV